MRAPSTTVQTGATAGALSIIIVWLTGQIWPEVVVPGEVAAAFTLIISSVAAWVVRDPAKGKH